MISRAIRLVRCYRRIRAFDGSDPIDFVFSQPISPLQVKSEIESLFSEISKLQPRSVCEIGTAGGGTLFLWCQAAHPSATIVSIDLPSGPFGGGYHWAKLPLYRSFARSHQTVKLLRRNSHLVSTVEEVKRLTPQLDFLFIDGDHTHEGVATDFGLYSRLVKKGGIIAFHDIVLHPPETGCRVHEFWERIKQEHPHREIIECSDQSWAGIGVLYI